ncbi:hypothetical protein PG995_009262 [Apiospora arundinis]
MVLKYFKYSPLPSTGYVRLVTLLQGSGMPIRCRLEEHSVTELPQYDALSYTWGFQKCPHDGSSPRGTRYIILNDLMFRVQDNLFSALMELRNGGRHGDQGLPIWIDAICINQDDDQEKSHQVGSMSLIYSSAEQNDVDHLSPKGLKRFIGMALVRLDGGHIGTVLGLGKNLF